MSESSTCNKEIGGNYIQLLKLESYRQPNFSLD